MSNVMNGRLEGYWMLNLNHYCCDNMVTIVIELVELFFLSM
jgi:hypothetical protein